MTKTKERAASDKLVEEKQESTQTIAKAGAFWALLAVPIILWRKLRKRR
jgi:hypothetical protein